MANSTAESGILLGLIAVCVIIALMGIGAWELIKWGWSFL